VKLSRIFLNSEIDVGGSRLVLLKFLSLSRPRYNDKASIPKLHLLKGSKKPRTHALGNWPQEESDSSVAGARFFAAGLQTCCTIAFLVVGRVEGHALGEVLALKGDIVAVAARDAAKVEG
jgi:hypothetical protein